MLDRDRLRAEARRIHARYVIEVVEALGFCPWARGAREHDTVCTRILLDGESDLDAVIDAVVGLELDARCEIGLLVFPQLELGRIAFQHFAAAVRAGYEPRAGQSRFALADFHPDAAPNLSSAAELVPFVRRSPDPTLQLVRLSAIAAVRRGEQQGTRFLDASALATLLETNSEPGALSPSPPPLHERLAAANLRAVQELGVERVLATLIDIERDRDRSYAQLGLAPPPWRRPQNESGNMGKSA